MTRGVARRSDSRGREDVENSLSEGRASDDAAQIVQRVPWCRWPVLLCLAASAASAFAVVLAGCRSRPGAASTTTRPPEAPWIVLFDGSSLGAWKPCEFGGSGAIRVEDGRLRLEQGSPMTGVRFVAADPESMPHGDYELEVEAARLAGNDFFCGLTFPVGDRALTLVLGGWGGTLCGLSCLDGRDASMNDTSCYRKFERGRVHLVNVRVAGGRVRATLDGAPLIDTIVAGRVLTLRPEVEPCAPLGIATYATTGAISAVRWRRAGTAGA